LPLRLACFDIARGHDGEVYMTRKEGKLIVNSQLGTEDFNPDLSKES
jgi:hypothetical protein